MRSRILGKLLAVGGLSIWSAMAIAEPGARATRGLDGVEELTSQDREILAWASAMANEVAQVLERWVSSQQTTEERLFSRLYYPIPRTDPPKYTTDYDALADRDLPPLQERYLNKSDTLIYAVTSDISGYVPSHNKKFAMPATGNRAVDLVSSRTKRLFGDKTGTAAARNEAPYLLQHYRRDTGEAMADLSVPINVKGRHWGCVRFGYRRLER